MHEEILPIPKHYSSDLKNLVDLLLKKNANLRPSIDEILSFDFIVEKLKQFNINPCNGMCYKSQNSMTSQQGEENAKLFSVKLEDLQSHNTNSNQINRQMSIHSLQEDDYSSPTSNNRNKSQQLVSPEMKFNSKIFQKEQNSNISTKEPSNFNIKLNSNYQKKYSPSYGINDMQSILKELKITELDNMDSEQQTEQENEKINKYAKNQRSDPELLNKNYQLYESPEKNSQISMEESNL